LLQAYLSQPLSMRITAFSNAISNLQGHVTIFDVGAHGGPPSATGSSGTQTIASKMLLGLRPDGSAASFSWTPLTIGIHHLYAVMQNSDGTQPLGDVFVQVRSAPGDLNEDGRVDTHDLNMLSRDLGKTVAESACGTECDFDGDGKITQKDAALMTQLCDSPNCAFAKVEYVGGPSSPLEPDMRAVRSANEAAIASFLAANNPQQAQLVAAQAQVGEPQMYQAELSRKQALQNIRYYYKGQLVTTGPYATRAALASKN
jgi:hypothetical protein